MVIARRMVRTFMVLLILAGWMPAAFANANVKSGITGRTAVISAHQSIGSGLQKYLERAYKEADEGGASYVILDLNTLGGGVDAALGIGELIRGSKVPTAVLVHGKAVSAGTYIALNANRIYMERGSSIGAAAVVDSAGKEVESAKVISFWSAEMRSAAELRGRNPDIAVGMVDKSKEVSVPALGKTFQKGELISLTADEALKAGYADGIAQAPEDVQRQLGLTQSQLWKIGPTPAERAAQFLTLPAVMTVLLMLGLAGIAVELFVPGFGLPGIIGTASFALYFFGHYAAGFAGVEDVFLFVIGLVLLVVEIFVPGFGIWAVAGIVCLMAGVVMAAYDSAQAARSLGIGFVLAAVVAGIVIYIFRRRGVWNRFILKESLTTESGFVSQESKAGLTGRTGITVTPLRPAGTVMIDGERVDVVTRGEFIPPQTSVKVLKAEGARIIVASLEE